MSEKPDLLRTVVTGLKWNYGGAIVRAVSQLLIGTVLARILGPEPFGIVAVATLVIGLGNLVADFGFGAAIVQRKELTEAQVRYVFTIQVLIGFALSALTAAGASAIAQFVRRPDAAIVVQALSPMFLVQALGQTSLSLLRRNMDFKAIQLVATRSYLVSYIGLGLPLALLGFGVWSLVLAQLAQSLLCSSLYYRRMRHSLRPTLQLSATGLNSFGGLVIATNLVNWIISNAESVVISRAYGVASLGLYNRAFLLMSVPMNSLVSVLQGVLFPAYSKVQDDRSILRRTYLSSLNLVSLIMVPVFLTIAVVPRAVIVGMYGQDWAEAVPIAIPLALAMPFHALMALAGPVMWGHGRVYRELLTQVLAAVFFLGCLFSASRISLSAVTWSVLAAYILRFLLMTSSVQRLLNVPWLDVWLSLRGSLMLASCTVVAGWTSDRTLYSLGTSDVLRLLAAIVVSAVVYLAIAGSVPSLLFTDDTRRLFRRVTARWPTAFQRLAKRVLET